MAELSPWRGDRQPAFTLQNIEKENTPLTVQRGQLVLVHFFATWCEPCRDEMQSLRRLVERAAPERLRVIAISVAEPDVRVRNYFEKTPVNFTILLDRDRAVAKSWNVSALPTSFILDDRLTPRLFVERDYDWDKLDVPALTTSISSKPSPKNLFTAHVRQKNPRRERMNIHRRNLLKAGAAFGASAALPNFAFAQAAAFAPKPGVWRQFQIVTTVEIAKPDGKAQAWIPVPSVNELDWFKSGDSKWTTTGKAALKRDPKYKAAFVHVEWDDKQPQKIEIVSNFTTQDRALDLSKQGKAGALSDADRKLYTGSTTLIPTTGIVKETSDKIVAGASTDIEKARKIYEWVVENTARNAATRGCGIGDIAAMLKTGNLTGKCADLNALYVGLARAQGIPARDVYGIRVAPSKFGYKSLGAGSATITKAQHCRSEVHLAGFGWVPVDPADVRKVVLEEPPANLALNDPKVVAARAALFGGWEGNWLAYNFAHDVSLPGAKGPALEFLMYPQAETASLGRLDCLDPDNMKYVITAKEVTSA